MRLKRVVRAAALAAVLAASAGAQELLTFLPERVTGDERLTISAPTATTVGVTLDGYEVGRVPVERGRAQIPVNFGSAPFPHTLLITAYDAKKQVLGVARRHINTGGRASYVELLAPYARSDPGSGTLALACAHLQPDAVIASAALTSGDASVPLLKVDDRRCDGIALAAVLPEARTPYLSATVTLQDGEMLEDTIPLDRKLGFGEEVTVRRSRYLVRPVSDDGSTVSGIEESQFQILEDRKGLPIKTVAPLANAPLDLAIVLDASQSTFGDTAMEQVFVDSVLALLKPGRDRAIVYAINTTPRPLLSDWTGDHAVIEKALRTAMRLKPGSTSAYDTLEEVISRFQSTGSTNLSAGAVLYMTDGSDSIIAHKGREADERRREQVLRYVRGSGIQVYSIAVSMPMPARGVIDCLKEARNGMNPVYLDALAQLTGGEHTLVTLDANPAPFLREAEKLAPEVRTLELLKTEDSLKLAQRKRQCMNHFVEQYEKQVAASLDTQAAERIRKAITDAGEALRTQYVLEVETFADKRPRERRLEFVVQHPNVHSVRGPLAAFY